MIITSQKSSSNKQIIGMGIEDCYFPENIQNSNQLQTQCRQVIKQTLRGGGCGTSFEDSKKQNIGKKMIPEDFFIKLKTYLQQIHDKSRFISDKYQSEEVLISFQWFHYNKEHIQTLCMDAGLCGQNYSLVIELIKQNFSSLKIYVKVSGFLFHQLLQITNNLFRIVYYQHTHNQESFLQIALKEQFLQDIAEIETQMNIESSKIWMNGSKFELQMIKINLAHLKTDSKEGTKLLTDVLTNLASSFASLKPSPKLLSSLFEGAKYLFLEFYDKKIQNPIQQYQIYDFFENLKWSIIQQLKNKQQSIQSAINQLQDGYQKYIKVSSNWIVHFCWVTMLSELIAYRPIISKQNNDIQNLNELLRTQQVEQLSWDKRYYICKFNKESEQSNFYPFIQIFQEFLLQQKGGGMKLLDDYITFEFDKKKEIINNEEEQNLSVLFSESGIENIKKIVSLISNCLIQIKTTFNYLIELIQSKEPDQELNRKILLNDFKVSIKKFNQKKLLLLYIVTEFSFQLQKEIESIKILEKAYKFEKQKVDQKEKQSFENKQKLIYENSNQIIQLLKNIPQFFIKASQCMSQIKANLESNLNFNEQTITQLFNLSTFDSVISQIIEKTNKLESQIIDYKNNLLLAKFRKNISMNFEPTATFQRYSIILIDIFTNPILKQIYQEFFDMYFQSQNLSVQSQDTLKDDTGKIQQCYVFRKIIKGILGMLKIHKIRICEMQELFKEYQKEEIEQDQQYQSEPQKMNMSILRLIKHQEDQFSKIFIKHAQQLFKEQMIEELNGFSLMIQQGIKDIKTYNMIDNVKNIVIQILEMISLTILLQNESTNLKENILNLYTSLKNTIVNQINFTDKNKNDQNQEQRLNLKSFKLYNYNESLKMLDLINKNLKNFKSALILSQNRMESLENNLDGGFIKQLKQSNQFSINQMFININKQTKDYLEKELKLKQYLFDQESINLIPFESKINSFSANLFLFDQRRRIQNINDEIKIDQMFSELLTLLKQENNQIQKDGMLKDAMSKVFQNQSFKVRESLTYNLVKLQHQIQENQIYSFCQNLIKQIWVMEKHPNVRNILKNQEMLEMQKQLFSRDLTTISQKIKQDFDKHMKEIEDLQNSLIDVDNQEEILQKLRQAQDDFEAYLENITEMSQKLDITIMFLKDMTKDLKSIKGKVDKVLTSVNAIEEDVRRLRGKSWQELLEIRKKKVEQQKIEAELDQIHIDILTIEYDPATGQKIEDSHGVTTSSLLKEDYDDFQGEVNEFLWCESETRKDIMLLKGKAGSGKSRAVRNIEEFLWKNVDQKPNWHPIYISLPSIQYPLHNIIDQGLECENYHFDKIQTREFKDAVRSGQINIVLILDSYDEMNSDCIEQNLYQTNKLGQDFNINDSEIGQKVKIIITTRDEILTSQGYQTWFYGDNLEEIKEVELQPFNDEQRKLFIKRYTEISVKRLFIDAFKYWKQLEGKSFSIMEFQSFWVLLEGPINNIIISQRTEEMIFSEQIADQLIAQISEIESFNYMQKEQKISLKKYLIQLWGETKYNKIIKNVNIKKLLTTPFMIEMIIQVLPKISQIFSDSSTIIKMLSLNYTKIKMELIQSQELEKNYNCQDLKSTKVQKKTKQKVQEELDSTIEILEEKKFFDYFSISNSLDYLNTNTLISNQQIYTLNEAEIVFSALKLHKFTPFDFYETFVSYYHNLQLQKLKDLGKISNYDSVAIDLLEFSTYLALDMTLRQLTQVNYKRKGKLVIQHAQDEGKISTSWKDQYFSENSDDYEYRQLIKKCSLISIKGNSYSFNHKSIQEYFVANYVFKLFQNFDLDDLQHKEKEEKILSSIQKSFFNKKDFNLSQEHYQGTIDLLKGKILNIINIMDFKGKLFFILKKSIKGNNSYLRCASNSIYILGILEEYLGDENLNDIQLSDTKLNGLSFSGSSLDNTVFTNVSIDSCNFNNASIRNAQWTNIICREKKELTDNTQEDIIFTKFSNNEKNLLSFSKDNKLNLWDISGDKIYSIDLNMNKIQQLESSQDLGKLVYISGESQNKGEQFVIGNINEKNQFKIEKQIKFQCSKLIMSLNGDKLAVQSKNSITVWKLENLNEPKFYTSKSKTTSRIVSIAILNQSNVIITGSQNGQILLWDSSDLNNLKIIKTLKDDLQGDIIESYVASSKDQITFAYSYANSIFIQEINQQSIIELNENQSIKQLSFSNINNQFFGVRTQDSIIIYEKSNYTTKLLEIQEQCKYFSFSTNDKILAIIKQNGIELFDLENKSSIKELLQQFKFTCLSFSENSQILAIGNDQCQVEIYRVPQLDQINNKQSFQCFSTPKYIQFSKNSELLFISQEEGIQIRGINQTNIQQLIPVNLSNQITNDFVLARDEQFIGIGINDQLCFYDQSISSTIESIHRQQEQVEKVITFQFQRKSKKLSIFTQNLQLYQYQLNEEQDIQKKSFNNDEQEELANLATISSDEHFLVMVTESGTSKNCLKIIDIKEKFNVVKLEEQKGFCIKLYFSPDSQTLISGYQDNSLKLWDTKSCKHLATVNNHPFEIGDITISNKGILAYASYNIIKVFNLQALKQQSQEMNGHSSKIEQLIVSSDGIQLISCSSKEMMRWDLTELKLIDSEAINSTRSTFSQNNRYFVSKDKSKMDEKFECLTLSKQNTKYIVQKKVKLHFTNCYSYYFSNDSQYLYSSHEYNTIVKWNLDEASLIKQNIENTKSQQYQNLNNDIIFLNYQQYFKLQGDNIKNPIKQFLISQHSNSIEITDKFQPKIEKIYAISQDLHMIATQNQDNNLIIWELNSKQEERLLDTNLNILISTMIFSKDNTILFTFGDDQKISLWNTQKNQGKIKEIKIEISSDINAYNFQVFPFKQDDFLLVQIPKGEKSAINYWFTNSIQQCQIKPNIGDINSATFCESRDLLALQSNHCLELINLKEDKPLPILEGNSFLNQYQKNILQFSQDGNRLYSLGRDHTLRCWDLSNLDQIQCKVYLREYISIKAYQIEDKGDDITIMSNNNIIYVLKHEQLQQISSINKITQFQPGNDIIINSSGAIEYKVVQNINEIIIKSINQNKIFEGNEGLSNLKKNQSIDNIYMKINENGQIIFYDHKDKQIFKKLDDQSDIICIAFSNDFNYMACAKQDQKLYIYNFNSKKTIELKKFECEISAICFTPCNKKFILGMENGSILLYEFDLNLEKIVCFKVFAKYPLLQAQECLITGSNFTTKENDNLKALFTQKGARDEA